jgi:chemotaxis protein CheD
MTILGVALQDSFRMFRWFFVETLKNKVRVDISDGRVSGDPGEVLATYALGSCMGVCLYDPVAKVGGMLHCLLPDSSKNVESARANPFQYADSGMRKLMDGLAAKGAVKRRLVVKLAGGAKMLVTSGENFDIGKQNYLAVRKALWKYGVMIKAEDVGSDRPRTMYLDIEDGSVLIRSRGVKTSL